MSGEAFAYQSLTDRIRVCTTAEHGFGTDACLLAHFAAPRRDELACDLGTGCGIIPLFWAREGLPSTVYAVDIQPLAIRQCKLSLMASQIGNTILPVEADLRALPASLPLGSFTLATCNPPYFPEGSGAKPALEAGRFARHEGSCTTEDIFAAARKLLRFGGRFCLCQRPERLTDVLAAARASGIEPKRLQFVAKTAADAPWLFLLECKRGAKPSLRLLPQLNVYGPDGSYTAQMEAVYAITNEETGESTKCQPSM